jgi:hypothetical protein
VEELRRKQRKPLERIAGVPAENRNKDLPNTPKNISLYQVLVALNWLKIGSSVHGDEPLRSKTFYMPVA